jgi:hypothetical protein
MAGSALRKRNTRDPLPTARLSIDPLLAREFPNHGPDHEDRPYNIVSAAACFDLTPEAVYRMRQTGISYRRADELCAKAWCHPSEIWPEWATIPEEES